MTWPLPKLDEVEIAYTTSDRFGDDDADPHIRYVQYFAGDITGIVDDYASGAETRVALGKVDVGRIDLYETGDILGEVLDEHSSEWVAYYAVVDHLLEEHHHEWITRNLVILDRVEIVAEARGHGLGLHAAARALRSWADDESLIVATAWPPDGLGTEARKAAERLARYWQRLGLERVDRTRPPILYGHTRNHGLWDALVELSAWASPEQS